MTSSPKASSSFLLGVWGYALGYFICYVPFSALTKALSEGKVHGAGSKLSGFQLLPVSALASLLGTIVFLWATGWWRYSGRRQIKSWSIPMPNKWTFLSGVGSSAIIITTTLSYTFKGVSIVFVMLLMRGGVLCLAPLVDSISGRRVRWFSWVALTLSLLALWISFSEKSGYSISVACTICVAVYLLSYFVRLRFMSHLAKSDKDAANRRYFVEEQWVATPVAVLALFGYGALGQGEIASDLWFGYTQIWHHIALPQVLWIGVLSQAIGICGGLLLLEKQENTFCVPINRSSSILAGVVASLLLNLVYSDPMPSSYTMTGALFILVAILFLTLPPLLEKRRLRIQLA